MRIYYTYNKIPYYNEQILRTPSRLQTDPETYFTPRVPMQFISTCSVCPQYGKRSTHRRVAYSIRNSSMARRDPPVPFYNIYTSLKWAARVFRPIRKKKKNQEYTNNFVPKHPGRDSSWIRQLAFLKRPNIIK